MVIRISADMKHGYDNNPIVSTNTHDEKTLVANDLGMRSHHGNSSLLQRHDHRVFFDQQILDRRTACTELRQTIFCSGSWIDARTSLQGYTSLSHLWPEYPYNMFFFKPVISAASGLVPTHTFNNRMRDIPFLIAEYLLGDQTVKNIKDKIVNLNTAYNFRNEEIDVSQLVAEYAYEDKEQLPISTLAIK